MSERISKPGQPENPLHILAARRRVRKALGKQATVPLPGGYSEGLVVDNEIHEKITAVVETLLTGPSLGQFERFDSVKERVPVRIEERAQLRGFSKIVDLGHHVETVRNLFVAQGNPDAAKMSAYQYVRVNRVDNPKSPQAAVQDKSCPDIEYYIIGFGGPKHKPRDLRALGVLSLAPTALELLAISDHTMRLEPGDRLPENSIPATLRIYDLVAADQEMGSAA
jgi:hypothetical protein